MEGFSDEDTVGVQTHCSSCNSWLALDWTDDGDKD